MTEVGKGKIDGGTSNFKLRLQEVIEVCKKNCPMNIEQLISHIQFQCGFSRENTRSKIRILLDVGKLEWNPETKEISLKGD